MQISVRYRNRSTQIQYDCDKAVSWNVGVGICALQIATGMSIFSLWPHFTYKIEGRWLEEFGDVKKIIKDNVALDLVLKQGRNLSKIAHLIDLSDESSSSSSSDSEEIEMPVELTII